MSPKISFLSPDKDLFAQTLRSRIDNYFREKGISRYGNSYLWTKAAFYLGSYVGLYFAILSGWFSEPAMLLMAAAMGFFVAGIGFNVGHDAVHGSFSESSHINRVMGHAFTLIGANVYNWNICHNIVHHSYTNIPEADGDLHPMPFLKFHPGGMHRPVHRYQHWYAFFLYSLTSLAWAIPKDFRHFFQRRLIAYDKPKPPVSEYFWLFGGKGAYYVAMWVVPALVLGLVWWKILIGFVVMHLIAGFMLATVFQLGHLVEGTKFTSLPDGPIPVSWMAHQIEASANFAPSSRLALWVTGGLNFQIEHHLFPRMSHVHYPKIAEIVKTTAAEFGVNYTEYPSFLSALASHRRLLRKLGETSVAIKPPASAEIVAAA